MQNETPSFSLVQGGPTYQLLRRLRLCGNDLEFAPRRIVAICLVAWLPLVILTSLKRHAFSGILNVPFLYDVEAHVRLLVTLPILIASERFVQLRLGPLVSNFTRRHIIREPDMPRYQAAVVSAMRLRDSVVAEIVVLILAIVLGQLFWRNSGSLDAATWYAIPERGGFGLTPAGYWYIFVSLPIVQFLLLRWYFRFFVWCRFLIRVSRLQLHLIPTHPDRAGGLGFLGTTSYIFAPLLFAQGALLSGLIATRVLYAGQKLLSFKVEAAAFIGFFVVAVLAPLCVFALQLVRAKLDGQGMYGRLATTYVAGFENKWGLGEGAGAEDLLGTSDIQSLADLDSSYAIVKEMRTLPFSFGDAMRLVWASSAPLLPLAFVVFTPEQLIEQLVKVLV
jgi:hypothetical protein